MTRDAGNAAGGCPPGTRDAPTPAETVEAMDARFDELAAQTFERVRPSLRLEDVEARFDVLLDQLGLPPAD
jgi:hypothetical protein